MTTPCANDSFINQQEANAADTGLRIIGTTILGYGFVLFRFVSRSDRTALNCACSPWWLQARSVRDILTDARHTGAPVSSSAQMNAAVAAAWKNSCQYMLVAKVYYPLKCFYGSPRPVGLAAGSTSLSGLPDKTHITQMAYQTEGLLLPDYSVEQFYIPGLNIGIRHGGETEGNAKARVEKLVRTSLKIRPQVKLGKIPAISDGGVEGMLREFSEL